MAFRAPQSPLFPEGLPRPPSEVVAGVVRTTLANMAIQDFVMVSFHALMWIKALLAPDGTDSSIARGSTLALLCGTVVTLLLCRGAILTAGPLRAMVYRLGMFGPMLCSYFTLRALLHGLQPVLLDSALLRIDEFLFGVTPSKFLDQFVTHGSVEWFSFFYYGYFYVLAVHLLGSLFFDEGRRMFEILFGAMLVMSLGHAIYTLVPGEGPFAHFPGLFQNELSVGGFWWAQVSKAVSAAGAQYDIFPSLHTAFPSFFALHAFRHRRTKPYKYTWPINAFVAINIMIATLFLRWHYGFDVLAGLCLAFSAQRLAIAAYRVESGRRDVERHEVWEAYRG